MKKVLKLSLIVMTMIGLSSCDLDEDGYSLGNIWVDFGLVESNEDGSDFLIRVDDGYAIIPVNQNQIDSEEYSNNTRVIVNYTIVGDKVTDGDNQQYYAKINQLRKVLYKDVIDITPEIEDSIGNDPIHVENVWVSEHMLNFRLQYFGSSKIHFVNLVKQPGEITADNLPVELELRHNTNGDDPDYTMSAYVTFDLSSLQIEAQDSVSFVVKATDFDDQKFTFEGVYKY